MRLALVAALALALPGCKQRDPKASARVPPDATPADARPLADLAHARAGARVTAGSLLAPTIEVSFAVLLPKPATAKTLAALAREARARGFTLDGEPPQRWMSIVDSTPRDEGFDPDEVLLRVAPADEPRIAEAEHAIQLVVGGQTADLDAIHRDAIQLARKAATEGHGWVLDQQTAIAFDVAALDERLVPSARNAVELIAYLHGSVVDADGLRTFETIGMPRFGLPDLRVRSVPSSLMDQLGNAIDATAQTLLAHGGLVEDGLLTVDLANLPELAEVAGICKDNHGTAKLAWQVTWADVGADTPPMLELEAIGPDDAAHRLGAALDTFYGIADRESVELDTDTPGLLAAARQAREELQQLRDRLDPGIPDGETVSVLAPFDVDGGGEYWLWVDVTRWKGRSWLTGVIVESPPPGAHLDLGQAVDVAIGRVLDYVHVRADGTEAGNLTAAIFDDE